MINYKLRIENILKRDLHYFDVHNKAVKDFLALMKLYADEAIDNKKEVCCCSCGVKEVITNECCNVCGAMQI